jgi:hypothetical protein
MMRTHRLKAMLFGLMTLVAVSNTGCRSHQVRCCPQTWSPVLASPVTNTSNLAAVQSYEQMKTNEVFTAIPIMSREEATVEIHVLKGKVNQLRDDVDKLSSKLPDDAPQKAPG